MKTKIVKRIGLVLAAGTFAVFHCSLNDPNGAGNSSQTGNPALAGVVYNQDGSRAAGAKVRIARWNQSPQVAGVIVNSTISNDIGGYKIDSMAADTFNLLASSGNKLGYKDSIKVKSDTTTIAPPCTLKAKGSVSGVVRLEPGDNSTNVYILFMGTNTFVRPSDSIGNFTASNLAEGRYIVKIITILPNYDPMDTSFTITAGVDAVLPDTLRLHYTGIPIPQGLRIEYDTMKQIVTLIWDKPTNGTKVKGYNIYRRNVDSNTTPATINPHLVTDTIYNDSTGTQDQTYEYSVSVMDTHNTEGVKSAAVSVKVVSAFTFIKKFGQQGTGTGQFSSPADIVVDAGANYWIADGSRNKIMKFDSSGAFLFEWGVAGTDSGKLNNPYGLDIDPQGNIVVSEWSGSRVQKFDTLGNLILDIDSSGIGIADVSVSEDGSIYFSMAAGGNQKYICKYTSDGRFIKSWQLSSTNLNNGLVVRKGKVYCATFNSASPYDDNVIEVFDTAGTPLTVIHIRRPGETGVIDIRDLDVDNSGKLYAVDPEYGKVRVFDANLNYLTSFGKKGNGANEFSWIQGISINHNTIAITDLTAVHLLNLP